ncbi:unnamed protein product, partial [Rotaria sp. Silwood1]
MKNFIILLLFISSSQFSISSRKQNHYDQRQLEEIIEILKIKFTDELEELISTNYNIEHHNDNPKQSENYEPEVDPNDHVDIKLWNKLNEKDIKKMPVIDDYSDEAMAMQWLAWYIPIAKRYSQVGALLNWNYETNITKENQAAMTTQNLIRSPFSRLVLPIAKKFNEHMKYSKDDDLKRIFGRLATGATSDNNDDVKRTSKLHGQLEDIYSTTKVCELNDNKKCYTFSPYIERLMQIEKDYDRLLWAWKGWHD